MSSFVIDYYIFDSCHSNNAYFPFSTNHNAQNSNLPKTFFKLLTNVLSSSSSLQTPPPSLHISQHNALENTFVF